MSPLVGLVERALCKRDEQRAVITEARQPVPPSERSIGSLSLVAKLLELRHEHRYEAKSQFAGKMCIRDRLCIKRCVCL